MLTLEYINSLILDIPGFEATPGNIENKTFSVTGYDAAIALAENARIAQFPIAILEEKTSGSLSAEYGGIDSFSQSLWVMVGISERNGITKSDASKRAFELLKGIIRQLLNKKSGLSSEVVGLDATSMPYFTRNVSIASGYEIILTFNNDMNLSDENE